MTTNYNGAYQALAKVVSPEAALNLCLVHAGLRPGFSDGPEEYGDRLDGWKDATKQGLAVAAKFGMKFKVSWLITDTRRFNLFTLDRKHDLTRTCHYEFGQLLGFPDECLAQLGTLKWETFSFHFYVGDVDVFSFCSWHASKNLFSWSRKTGKRLKAFVNKHQLPFKRVALAVTRSVPAKRSRIKESTVFKVVNY